MALIPTLCGENTIYVPPQESGDCNLAEISIDENGVYSANSAGYDGYSQVIVAVQPNLQRKIVITNGTVTADSGYDGLSEVVVNVPATDTPRRDLVATLDWANMLTLGETQQIGGIYWDNTAEEETA